MDPLAVDVVRHHAAQRQREAAERADAEYVRLCRRAAVAALAGGRDRRRRANRGDVLLLTAARR